MAIRCFIAVELSGEVKRGLGRLQRRLQEKWGLTDRSIRWVRPENIHLTLKFLGDTDDRLIPEVCAAASRAAEGGSAFEITLAGCGCFPQQGAARVIWAGISEGVAGLGVLQEKLEVELGELGFAREKRQFSPHLTLARVKQAKTGHIVRERLAKVGPVEPGSQEVSGLTVFQSELTQQGPIYTAMHRVNFGK